MVLHLLGKKSWNVYNSANVERVKRDEAEAQAKEEAEEQRMQEQDAQRRIAILRGEQPPPLPEITDDGPSQYERKSRDQNKQPRERKRRRLRGEDDTDRDIRYVREDAEAGEKARQQLTKPKDDDAPLHDRAGHLQLIPAPDEATVRRAEKNAEAEAEKAKKRKRDEDQYTMRFSNAAGFRQGMQKPWYTTGNSKESKVSNSTDLALAEVQNKDVWGNDDPRRREREQRRVVSSDPFAFMQQAQRQLKQSERDRETWNKERAKETEELERAESKRRHREKRHRRRDEGEDTLDGFGLDAPSEDRRHDRDERRHRKDKHRRSRHRDSSRRRSYSGERSDPKEKTRYT